MLLDPRHDLMNEILHWLSTIRSKVRHLRQQCPHLCLSRVCFNSLKFLTVGQSSPTQSRFTRMNRGHVSALSTDMTTSGKRRIFRCQRCETTVSERRDTVCCDLRPSEAQVLLAWKLWLVRGERSGIACVRGVHEETVLAWRVRAAANAHAIHAHVLRDLTVRQALTPWARKTSRGCKDRERMRQRVGFFQACDHVARPHMRVRRPLPMGERIRHGAIRPRWGERTPAMAAGLTDHVWTFRELLTATFEP